VGVTAASRERRMFGVRCGTGWRVAVVRDVRLARRLAQATTSHRRVGASNRRAWGARAVTPWQSRALCRQLVLSGEMSRDDWFPSEEDGRPPRGAHAAYKRAREVCAQCPVQAECLEYALEHCLTHGMWGGCSPIERRRLARPRTCAECGKRFVVSRSGRGQRATCSEECTRLRHNRQSSESARRARAS